MFGIVICGINPFLKEQMYSSVIILGEHRTPQDGEQIGPLW